MDRLILLKELNEGFSTQAKTANKYWGFLIIVSIISMSGDVVEGKVNLPLDLGRVTEADFRLLCCLMISVFFIAFASALLQSLRARAMINKVIESTKWKDSFINETVHQQDLVDLTAVATVLRVAPIAQYIKGGFFEKNKPKVQQPKLPWWLYVILKIVAVIVVLFFPMIALFKNAEFVFNYKESGTWNIPIVFYWFLIGLSIVVFLIVLWANIEYTKNVKEKIAPIHSDEIG